MGEAPLVEEFLAHCPELLFILDRHGGILQLSSLLSRLLGPEARPSAALASFIHPEDAPSFEAGFAELAASLSPTRLDVRVRTADGSYAPASFNAQKAPARGLIHGALHLRDPEAAKLQEEGRLLRVLSGNLPLVLWAIDAQGVCTYHEGKGLTAFGLSPGQFLGVNFLTLYAGHEGAAWLQRSLEGEFIHEFSQAYGVYNECWHVPVRGAEGEVTAVLGITLDLSESKRAEMELREKLALIERQQQVIRSLSTPIIEVWDKVLTLPMLGVADSARAAEVMESLLVEVSRRGARFAILDLTGIEAVDTGTASHLLKMIQALRLLGAEGIITGIQPSVAQTMVALGVNLEAIVTLASLRDGLRFCMQRTPDGPSGSRRMA